MLGPPLFLKRILSKDLFLGPLSQQYNKGTDFEAELGTLHKPLTFYRKVNTLPSTSILEGEIKGWLASKGQRLL